VSDVQFGGGFLEATEPACGFKSAQCIERRQYPFHSE
jgi:hypothetical protein